jgi:hypothetical protein
MSGQVLHFHFSYFSKEMPGPVDTTYQGSFHSTGGLLRKSLPGKINLMIPGFHVEDFA